MNENNPPFDHGVDDADGTDKGAEEDKGVEENLKSRSTWMRAIFMAICCVLTSLATMVGSVVVLFGFLWVLFTGKVNRQIQEVGQSLAIYIFENVRFLTYNSDDKPFPLGNDWPSGKKAD